MTLNIPLARKLPLTTVLFIMISRTLRCVLILNFDSTFIKVGPCICMQPCILCHLVRATVHSLLTYISAGLIQGGVVKM